MQRGTLRTERVGPHLPNSSAEVSNPLGDDAEMGP